MVTLILCVPKRPRKKKKNVQIEETVFMQLQQTDNMFEWKP